MTEETTKTTESNTENMTVTEENTSTNKTPAEEKKDNRRKPRDGQRRERRPREPKEFEEAILQIDRVTRVVAGGRRLRFRVSVVVGDQKGRVGFGIGKSGEVMIGIQKAVAKAKKSLINVPIFNGTLPHEQSGKFKASTVLLFPAPEGKGVIAGGAARRILELAGVKDVLSKVHGSRNKLNIARATLQALQKLHNQAPLGKESEKEDTKTEEKNNKTTSEEKKKASSKKAESKEKKATSKTTTKAKKTTKK